MPPVQRETTKRVGFAVTASSKIVYSPLSEARSGFNSVSRRICHPSKTKSRSDLMDALKYPSIQKILSCLSQVLYAMDGEATILSFPKNKGTRRSLDLKVIGFVGLHCTLVEERR